MKQWQNSLNLVWSINSHRLSRLKNQRKKNRIKLYQKWKKKERISISPQVFRSSSLPSSRILWSSSSSSLVGTWNSLMMMGRKEKTRLVIKQTSSCSKSRSNNNKMKKKK